MEKKILLAVDDSIHSVHAVEYAVRMASVVGNLTYTLLCVQPTLSQYLLEEAERDLKVKAEMKKVIRRNVEMAYEVLEKHKARMVRMGIVEERIQADTRPKILGIAKDILDYAQQGLYDAILVGRRGLSRLQQTFVASVAAKLVAHSAVIPVWVIDGEVTSNEFMLAVDGSEASIRAADHLSFMLGGNEEIKVTVFHVTPSLRDYCEIDFSESGREVDEIIARGDKRCVEHFYAHARKTFRKAGFKDGQIDLKVVRRAMDVAKAIVNESKKGDFGTVIIGRRGASQSFFMGSVSRQVLDRVSGRAVWVVS